MVTKSELTRVADNIRILSAAMVEKAKSGHPGGAMGGADFMAVLYTEFLRYDPDQMDYPFRDRFFLDPGHMSPMLYSTLALAGPIRWRICVTCGSGAASRRAIPKWTCCTVWRIRRVLWARGMPWRWARDRRAVPRGSFRGVAVPQDLCLHLRRRYRGGGVAGRGPHRRPLGDEQSDHVLRLEQRSASTKVDEVQLRTSSIDRCTARTSEHRSMYSYVRLSIDDVQLRRLSIDRCTATYV